MDNIADIDAQLDAIQQLRGSLEKGSVASAAGYIGYAERAFS